jgi:Fur family transcriptional regulator, ferric uptake regulator
MPESSQQLATFLKARQQSLTKPRLIVFAALQKSEPLTMQQLVHACASVDRASIYRTIALFEKLGIVQRLQIGWKYKLELSDAFQRHHHHLTCLKCGRVIPFDEDSALQSKLRQISQAEKFKMSGHQLEIQGFCANCR